jgi:hypothetical protein
MEIRIGPYSFTSLGYHAFNDELDAYLEGRSGGVGKSSPELHVWYFAEAGSDEVIGITLNGVGEVLDHFGKVEVTLPDGDEVEAEGVAEYLEGRRRWRAEERG